MSFHYPNLLWLLVALLPMFWLWRVVAYYRQRRLARFLEGDTWPVLNPYVSKRSRWWKAMLFSLAIALSVIAAARPLWGTRERIVRERGIDIMVAMDVSRSMLAGDIEPSRLEQAKRRLRELLAQFPGQRIAIMPFAGEPFLQVPLTTDYGLALRALGSIDDRTIGTQGTDIAAAIERAREAFENGSVGSRVLILITDGEHHEGDVLEQARLAARQGIKIYALGIGTPKGTWVEYNGTILEDKDGHKVLSHLDAETLTKIAEITGGQAYVARPGEAIDVSPLVRQLAAMEQGTFDSEGSTRSLKEERYQIPLAMALILLFAEGLFGDRRRTPLRSMHQKGGAPA